MMAVDAPPPLLPPDSTAAIMAMLQQLSIQMQTNTHSIQTNIQAQSDMNARLTLLERHYTHPRDDVPAAAAPHMPVLPAPPQARDPPAQSNHRAPSSIGLDERSEAQVQSIIEQASRMRQLDLHRDDVVNEVRHEMAMQELMNARQIALRRIRLESTARIHRLHAVAAAAADHSVDDDVNDAQMFWR